MAEQIYLSDDTDQARASISRAIDIYEDCIRELEEQLRYYKSQNQYLRRLVDPDPEVSPLAQHEIEKRARDLSRRDSV